MKKFTSKELEVVVVEKVAKADKDVAISDIKDILYKAGLDQSDVETTISDINSKVEDKNSDELVKFIAIKEDGLLYPYVKEYKNTEHILYRQAKRLYHTERSFEINDMRVEKELEKLRDKGFDAISVCVTNDDFDIILKVHREIKNNIAYIEKSINMLLRRDKLAEDLTTNIKEGMKTTAGTVIKDGVIYNLRELSKEELEDLKDKPEECLCDGSCGDDCQCEDGCDDDYVECIDCGITGKIDEPTENGEINFCEHCGEPLCLLCSDTNYDDSITKVPYDNYSHLCKYCLSIL